ncbi:MAG: ERCC4 domain-containing protein [Candidatus Nezhaarchaeales archaeon]
MATSHIPSKAYLEVIVDSREAVTAKHIVDELKKLGVLVRIEFLEAGDYVVSKDVAIERKTVSDFISTLTKRNLFEQLDKIKKHFSRPVLILEGDISSIPMISSISMNSVLGALASIARSGISILPSPSPSATAKLISLLAKQERKTREQTRIRVKLPRKDNVSEEQIFFLCGLPMIGKERAEAILRVYRTPLEALKRVDGWSKTVEGIGEVIVKRVKEVLETPFKL